MKEGIEFGEWDYSDSAKRAHQRLLRQMDQMERRGKRVDLHTLKREQEEGVTKKAVKLLIEVFGTSDYREKHELFAEFQQLCRDFNIKVSFKTLRRMKAVWEVK